MALDILPSNPNVLGALSAQIQNPRVEDYEEAQRPRWRLRGVAPNSLTGDVYRFAASGTVPYFTQFPPTMGIRLVASGALDPTYEAGAGYLLGSVTYTAQMARTVTLSLRVGDYTMNSGSAMYFGMGDDAVSRTTPRSTSAIAEATITVGSGPGPYPLGDGNHDGQFNALDIGNFVSLLTSGTIPGPQPQLNLLGDINHDGYVNFQDGPVFVSRLISIITSGTPGSYDPEIDFNNDGAVTTADNNAFWNYMDTILLGATPSSSGGGGGMTVPEPAAVTLLVLFAGAMLRRRR